MRVDVNTSLQVGLQAGEEPDLYFTTALRGQSSCWPQVSDDLVSNERFYLDNLFRSIVCLQSRFLTGLVLSHPNHLTPCLQVPGLTYADLCSLVSLVYTGMARTEDSGNR